MPKLRHQYLRPSVDEQLPKPRNRDSKAGAGQGRCQMPDAIGGEVAFPGRKSHVFGVSCWCVPGVGHSDQAGRVMDLCATSWRLHVWGQVRPSAKRWGGECGGETESDRARECVSVSVCVLKCMMSVYDVQGHTILQLQREGEWEIGPSGSRKAVRALVERDGTGVGMGGGGATKSGGAGPSDPHSCL